MIENPDNSESAQFHSALTHGLLGPLGGFFGDAYYVRGQLPSGEYEVNSYLTAETAGFDRTTLQASHEQYLKAGRGFLNIALDKNDGNRPTTYLVGRPSSLRPQSVTYAGLSSTGVDMGISGIVTLRFGQAEPIDNPLSDPSLPFRAIHQQLGPDTDGNV